MGTYYNLPDERRDEIKKEAARFYEAWTAEEKEQVCQLFRNGMHVDEIARAAHRTVNAIRIKLIEAGEIARYLSRSDQPWTDAEIERLGRFHSQGYPAASCARLLGRRKVETEDKLIEIGLLAPREKPPRDPAHPKAFLPWPDEESARLVQELSLFRDALLGLARIAHDHGRSVGAIISHADKLGLCHITNI